MSPNLNASRMSQGSCLWLIVMTLETELLFGSAIMTTCSGLVSGVGEEGLGRQRGFLIEGMDALEYVVSVVSMVIVSGRVLPDKLIILLEPKTTTEDESGASCLGGSGRAGGSETA